MEGIVDYRGYRLHLEISDDQQTWRIEAPSGQVLVFRAASLPDAKEFIDNIESLAVSQVDT